MSTYTTKEQWQTLYDKSEISGLRKAAIDKLQEEGNQVYPGTENAAKEIWALCVAVAARVKANHTKIFSGRSYGLNEEGHVYQEIVSVDNSDLTITIANSDDEETETDEKMFIDCLKQCEHTYGGFINAFHHSKYGSRDLLKLSKLLPMLSLGIFQKSGKDWLDLCHDDVYVGRSNEEDDTISEGVSLTGHFDTKQEMIDIINLGEKMNKQISEIVDLLELRKNVILEGVPGTGKTWIRNKIKDKMGATLESTTFHPAKTYEEFVGGIFPQNEKGELQFHYLKGTVSNIANKAMNDVSEDAKYILFIDEINRANIPMVMGELLTIIESTKRTVPDGDDALKDESTAGSTWEVAVHTEPNLTKYLRLPSNLYFLATMNTSDRSVLSMDAALRRRFAYYRIETKLIPEEKSEMKKLLQTNESGEPETFWKKRKLFGVDDLFETLFDILADINKNILKKKIGPDAMLGHSYFFVGEDEVASLSDGEAVSEMLQLSILPQIADILTSMNKTNSGIVSYINSELRQLEDLGASHYRLKEPINNKNSLDIAVTVVRTAESDGYPDPRVLFDKDANIYRFKVVPHKPDIKLKPSNFQEFAYIRWFGPQKQVEILAGSAILPPRENFTNKTPSVEAERRDWIETGIVEIQESDYGIFAKSVVVEAGARAGVMVNGEQTFQGSRFKNNLGEPFPIY